MTARTFRSFHPGGKSCLILLPALRRFELSDNFFIATFSSVVADMP